MASFEVKTYNSISKAGLDQFGPTYDVGGEVNHPDAILLRSYDLHNEPIPENVVAVARAGAGVNNIPVDKMSERGIVVFNTPGANASAVKELVLAGMLMAARNLPMALNYTKGLGSDNLKEAVEVGKKQFAGFELAGKTLGIIGLGAIGRQVAKTSIDLGMDVIGYDPALPSPATDLPEKLQRSKNLKYLLKNSDLITVHVPLLDATKGLIDEQKIGLMKPSAVLLNFSRDQIVDEKAIVKALNEKRVNYYVTDFPNKEVLSNSRVIAMPHLGASTAEAEENCAKMAATQIQNFLEEGTIKNSINFPPVELERKGGARLTLVHNTESNLVSQIRQILSAAGYKIAGLANESRGDLSYSVIDIDAQKIDEETANNLSKTRGVIRLRVIQ